MTLKAPPRRRQHCRWRCRRCPASLFLHADDGVPAAITTSSGGVEVTFGAVVVVFFYNVASSRRTQGESFRHVVTTTRWRIPIKNTLVASRQTFVPKSWCNVPNSFVKEQKKGWLTWSAASSLGENVWYYWFSVWFHYAEVVRTVFQLVSNNDIIEMLPYTNEEMLYLHRI